jgi:hypothetical protein
VLATRQDLRLTNHERLWGWTTRLLEILKKWYFETKLCHSLTGHRIKRPYIYTYVYIYRLGLPPQLVSSSATIKMVPPPNQRVWGVDITLFGLERCTKIFGVELGHLSDEEMPSKVHLKSPVNPHECQWHLIWFTVVDIMWI